NCGNPDTAAEKDHVVVVPAVRYAPLIGGSLCDNFFLLEWYRPYVTEVLIGRAGRVEHGLRSDQIIVIGEARGRVVVSTTFVELGHCSERCVVDRVIDDGGVLVNAAVKTLRVQVVNP